MCKPDPGMPKSILQIEVENDDSPVAFCVVGYSLEYDEHGDAIGVVDFMGYALDSEGHQLSRPTVLALEAKHDEEIRAAIWAYRGEDITR